MCNGLEVCHQRRQCHRASPEPPSGHVTILRHCRCRDCEHWAAHPHNECIHGIIRNGLKPVPEFPADGWHYCALYHGPRFSGDVLVWPMAPAGAKACPRQAGGRPGDGPMSNRPGGEPVGPA